MTKSLGAFALATVLSFSITGCDSASSGPSTTAAALVNVDPELTNFRSAAFRGTVLGTINRYSEDYTVFAATDAAFEAAASTFQVSVGDVIGRPDIESVLFAHVVQNAELMSGDLADGDQIVTMQGETLTVVMVDGRIGLDTEDADAEPNAFIATADIDASNGVIHKVDGLLLPTE